MRILRDRRELFTLLPKGAVVAEIGVQDGSNARQIWELAKPRELHLIDPWVNQEVPHWQVKTSEMHWASMRRTQQSFADEIGIGSVVLHQGYSSRVLAAFREAYFDWVYLDGDHRYDAIHTDLELCSIRVKPDGIIAGHDYVRPEDSAWARDGEYGVVKAVEEFCREHNWVMIYRTAGTSFETDTTENPSFALRKIPRD